MVPRESSHSRARGQVCLPAVALGLLWVACGMRTGMSITVSYVNKGGSSLQLALWDGSNFWCYYLPPSTVPNAVNIPFSSLNTSCWDGKGTAFVSGTPVELVQLTVPGNSLKPTPFDYCFLGMTIQ
jgi:hypothetical protein